MSRLNQLEKLRVHVFHARELMRCTTPRRLANLVALKAQRWLHRERMTGMPAFYFIDPINICNLRCPLCPTGRGLLARPAGRMDLAMYQRVIDEIAPYAYRVELYNWGEPLLHPQIMQMIEYASRRRISVRLSSNMNHLDADMSRQLVTSGLSQLTVSIDGATQESYAAYRRQGQLSRVLQNLELLLETRRELGAQRPFILWRMLIGKHNEHEIEAVRQMAREMDVDGFATSVLFVDTHDPEQINLWLPTDPAQSAYDYRSEVLENAWSCHELWEGMVINWDGGVAPCCWLHDARYDFGNVSRQTVREIWNGPKYVSARRSRAGRAIRAADTITICHRCQGHPHYMAY